MINKQWDVNMRQSHTVLQTFVIQIKQYHEKTALMGFVCIQPFKTDDTITQSLSTYVCPYARHDNQGNKEFMNCS